MDAVLIVALAVFGTWGAAEFLDHIGWMGPPPNVPTIRNPRKTTE